MSGPQISWLGEGADKVLWPALWRRVNHLRCGCLAQPTRTEHRSALARFSSELMAGVIRRRVYCSPEVADACALWSAALRACIRPESRGGCGYFPASPPSRPHQAVRQKHLVGSRASPVRRPLGATDVSEAALFRTIDLYRPTILIDEADRLIAKNRGSRRPHQLGICARELCSTSRELQAKGVRTFEPVPFKSFAAIALAGIGSLPSTIEDRSIRIELQRQPRDQKAQRVGRKQLANMRKKIEPHLMAHADTSGRRCRRACLTTPSRPCSMTVTRTIGGHCLALRS